MSLLPLLTLDTRDLPPERRLSAWRAALPQYDVEAAGPESAFSVSARAWLLRDLVVTHTIVTGVRLARDAERIRTDGADTYNLNVLLRGSITGEADGQAVTAGPGQLIGFDLSRPFALTSEPNESVSIVIGRSVLQDAFGGEPALHGHIFDSVTGRLLSDHCLALARHLPSAAETDAAALVRSSLALLVAALPSSRLPEPSGYAGQGRIRLEFRRYIDRHIGSADLGPDGICEALGLSRTTLYRSFQPLGGVTAFIQRRRLQAVRALLLHPSETRAISDISQSLGFRSNSHFAAAFRKEYGCSPRDLRTGHRVPVRPRDAVGTVANQFQAWLADLGRR